jgi:hypothetical protein
MGWSYFLSRLDPLKLFVLKRSFVIFFGFLFNQVISISWYRWEVYPGGPGFFEVIFLFFFILSFKFWFFLKSNFFFLCFAFYWIILLAGFDNLTCFTGALFFSTFFSLILFSWFHPSAFWFMRIDDYYFLVLFRWCRVMIFFLLFFKIQ